MTNLFKKSQDLPDQYLDVETTGLNTFFCQLLRWFATGNDYIESDPSTYSEVACSMELSRLPEAEALVVNGVSLPSLVQENSLWSGIQEIIKYIDLNTPSIWHAHNASFDASVISNTIYQNLASPNLYPFKCNGNILLDTLMLVRAIHAFDSTCGLIIPKDPKGFPVFKLEALCAANSIKIDAHKAKDDTLALRELVNIIKQLSPNVYRNALHCSVKKNARQKLLDSPYLFAAIGTERNYQVRAFAPIAFSKEGSDCVVADLMSDIDKIKSYSPLEVSGFLGNKIHKKYSIFRLPLNKGVVLFSADELDFLFKIEHEFDEKELFRKASQLRRDEALSDTAIEALGWRESSFGTEDPTPEQRIYSHFPSEAEKAFIRAFNLSLPEDKWPLIEAYSKNLNDDRFIRLARRVCLQNWRPYCPAELTETYFKWCIERLFSEPLTQEDVAPWPTIYSCLSEIPKLKKKYPDKLERIAELENFYEQVASSAGIDINHSFDN